MQQSADIEKMLVVKCIEENDICAVRQALVEAVRNRLPGLLQVNQVYERRSLSDILEKCTRMCRLRPSV